MILLLLRYGCILIYSFKIYVLTPQHNNFMSTNKQVCTRIKSLTLGKYNRNDYRRKTNVEIKQNSPLNVRAIPCVRRSDYSKFMKKNFVL